MEQGGFARLAQLQRRGQALAPHRAFGRQRRSRAQSHLLLRAYLPHFKETWLRFVDGRPISAITTQFLCWCSEELYGRGKKVWVLIWDKRSLARKQRSPLLDQRTQPQGQEGHARRSEDHKLRFAHQEPVAERHGA